MPHLTKYLILDTQLFDFLGETYARYLQYLPGFLLMLLVAIILTPIVGYIAQKYDIVNETRDHIRNRFNPYDNVERRINPNAVPLLGGVAVIIPIIILIPLLFGFNPITTPIIIALLVLLIGGVLDDTLNLPGTVQFLFQLLAASIIAFSVIDLEIVKIPFDGVLDLSGYTLKGELLNLPYHFVLPGDLFMILWIMVCINAIKWVAGTDALMESNVIVAFAMLFIIAVRTDALFVIYMSMLLGGGIAGFTLFNFPPAKIFSGSVGKTSYGFILAVLSLLNDTKVATTIIILLLPFADFIFVLIKRFLLNKPKNIKEFLTVPLKLMRTSDTNHIHHQLIKLNFSFKQILLIELSINLLIGAVAVLTADAYRLFLLFVVGAILLASIAVVHLLVFRKSRPTNEVRNEESPESKYSY